MHNEQCTIDDAYFTMHNANCLPLGAYIVTAQKGVCTIYDAQCIMLHCCQLARPSPPTGLLRKSPPFCNFARLN